MLKEALLVIIRRIKIRFCGLNVSYTLSAIQEKKALEVMQSAALLQLKVEH